MTDEEAEYRCACGKEFESYRRALTHVIEREIILKVSSRSDDEYECMCGKKFDKYRKALWHIEKVHFSEFMERTNRGKLIRAGGGEDEEQRTL